jgi:hypothetical protein
MEQLIVTAILIIIAVISYVAQAIAKWRQVQEEEARRRQRQGRMEVPPQPPRRADPLAPRPPQQPAARPQQKPLEDEISEFLREAARRRSGDRPARPAGPKPPPPPVRERPVVVEVVEAAPAAPLRSTLETQKLPTLHGSIEQRHLEPDQEIESHLRGTFDHSVGSLGAPVGASTRVDATELAAPGAVQQHFDGLGLAAMFSNPVSLRQAILAHEIFRRPEERWS